jgi:hypothetical protein
MRLLRSSVLMHFRAHAIPLPGKAERVNVPLWEATGDNTPEKAPVRYGPCCDAIVNVEE